MKRTDNYLNKSYDIDYSGFTLLGLIALIIILIFIAPWVSFWLAYFGGWISKIVIGNYIVKGFALLGITVPLDKIPLLAGVLGWIGGFFKSVGSLKSNK